MIKTGAKQNDQVDENTRKPNKKIVCKKSVQALKLYFPFKICTYLRFEKAVVIGLK